MRRVCPRCCPDVLQCALQLQVVALDALAHLGKSEMGVGSIGDSYTLGVVSALCDSQDPDVRSAAVKAIGRCAMDARLRITDACGVLPR